MFTVFLFYKEKEHLTGERCVEMDIRWQLCRTIGPLLSQRFPLASAKAQPSGGFSAAQWKRHRLWSWKFCGNPVKASFLISRYAFCQY